MIRVLLADDEGMIRSALAALLRLEADIDVVAECADGEEAVAAAVRLEPDVCLLDLEMPGLDGVQVAERLNRTIATRCIVVTRHARPGVLRRALASGVSGFVPKSRGADELAAIIRRVAAGARYVDPEIAADALSDERSPLTDRELDVLRAGRRGGDHRTDRAGARAGAGDGAQPHLRHPREALGEHPSAGRARR